MSHEALETPAAPQPEPKPTPPKKRGRGWMIAVGLVVVAIVGATVASKFPGRDAKRPTPTPDPVPVSAQPVEKKNIPIQIRAIGNVEASSTVQIRSLVSGELLKVHFAEGQTVKKGELLFTLDQRPFEAALEQAQANLAKDQAQEAVAQAVLDRDLAQLNNAKKQAERYQELLKQGVVSQELSDQYRLNVETASAVVEADKASLNNVQSVLKADQAAIENAKIQLSYTKIQSPMDGRTGNLMVYAGNLVRANDTTPLVTINQLDPVFVSFSVPEKDLNQIKTYRTSSSFGIAANP
ncbi:MAG TPA: biotin/lipoyl-binding protein, partial [Acidobacteriota bacterium]|nr:biotin/lipoyl-binding protein [Acidobacteriota bacterium]